MNDLKVSGSSVGGTNAHGFDFQVSLEPTTGKYAVDVFHAAVGDTGKAYVETLEAGTLEEGVSRGENYNPLW